MSDSQATGLNFCYALTASARDLYADMCLVSAISLRIHHPDAQIYVVCDAGTFQFLKNGSHPLLQYADQIIPIATPDGTPDFKNRYLKTTLRKHLKGPFVYLDGDTLIRDKLAEIFRTATPFAAAANRNGTGGAEEITAIEKMYFENMRWKYPPRFYLNAGVLFFDDAPVVQQLCHCWHEKWLAFHKKTGKHNDQPALISAVNDTGIPYFKIPDRFNAQVFVQPHTAWHAAIWHFYCSFNTNVPHTLFAQLVNQQHQLDHALPDEVVQAACRQEHPWLLRNPGDYLALHFMRKPAPPTPLERWECLWLADRYGSSILCLIRTIRRKFRQLQTHAIFR